MLQLIGWRLRQMVRDVPMMFWGLAFPIIMGILFQVSFGNGSDEENMSVIPIALVSQENTNPFFEKFCEMLDGDTLTVQKVDEEEAQELLKQEEIAGIYYAGDPLRLKVSKAGMEQSILEMLLNVYEKNENADQKRIKRTSHQACQCSQSYERLSGLACEGWRKCQ